MKVCAVQDCPRKHSAKGLCIVHYERLRVYGRLESIRHGMKNAPEYHVWKSMNQRCSNPNDKSYRWYGAKGITVCDRWRNSFPNFSPIWGQGRLQSTRLTELMGHWATRLETANGRLCGNKTSTANVPQPIEPHRGIQVSIATVQISGKRQYA